MLTLNVVKTEFAVIESNQRIHALWNNQINIEIDGKSNEKVKEAKLVGLVIDEHVSWTRPIAEMGKKIFSAIGALKRVRPFISESGALQVLPSVDFTLLIPLLLSDNEILVLEMRK